MTSSNSFNTDGFSQWSWAWTSAGHNWVITSQLRFVTSERLFSPSTTYSAPYIHAHARGREFHRKLHNVHPITCTCTWETISLGTTHCKPCNTHMLMGENFTGNHIMYTGNTTEHSPSISKEFHGELRNAHFVRSQHTIHTPA